MAAINQIQLHPTAAALNGAALLAHRGAQPKLKADAADTLLAYNAWLSKEAGYGPFEVDLSASRPPPARLDPPGPPVQKTKTARRRRKIWVKLLRNRRFFMHSGHPINGTTIPISGGSTAGSHRNSSLW